MKCHQDFLHVLGSAAAVVVVVDDDDDGVHTKPSQSTTCQCDQFAWKLET